MACFMIIALLVVMVLCLQSVAFESPSDDEQYRNFSEHGGSHLKDGELNRYKLALKVHYQQKVDSLAKMLSDDDLFAAEVYKRKSKLVKDNEKTVADIKSFPWREGDPDKDYAMKVAEILPVLLQDEELVMFAVVHTCDNFDDDDIEGGEVDHDNEENGTDDRDDYVDPDI